ncbi:MAG: hypothetical protein E4H30_06745 [Methanomassiliicoccus sp.]|nr:MAG: hypothetical protein E4H30_06745 [Methanomassiliicoccus sp.]
MGLIEDLWLFFGSILEQIQGDPIVYGPVFFIYAIAAAVFLPIPVEFGLLLSPATPMVIKALILGLGKAAGSILVFYIGVNVEGPIIRFTERWNWFRKLVDACQRFVEKFGYLGLYVILSIPFMVDTVPIYLFSIFNKGGKTLNVRYFALVNFAAGVTRAAIIYAAYELFNVILIN